MRSRVIVTGVGLLVSAGVVVLVWVWFLRLAVLCVRPHSLFGAVHSLELLWAPFRARVRTSRCSFSHTYRTRVRVHATT